MREVRTSAVVLVLAMAGIFLAACGGNNDEPPAPTPSPTGVSPTPVPPTPTPTLSPSRSVEEEVAEAYLAYWDAYAQAVLHLDVSLVEDFVSEGESNRILEEIETLHADNVALRVRVDHDFQVVPISETSFAVIDEIVNNSFYVDAVTKDPPEGTGSGEILRYTFVLEKIEERWIVIQGSRGEPQ